ncbi:hypothetical protein LINPERHAP2_LOCUS16459 [Linum perenne]
MKLDTLSLSKRPTVGHSLSIPSTSPLHPESAVASRQSPPPPAIQLCSSPVGSSSSPVAGNIHLMNSSLGGSMSKKRSLSYRESSKELMRNLTPKSI